MGKGYSESHVNEMLEHMTSGKPFSETELMVYKKLFLEYCVLGGMPAVVKQFIETNTFSETLEIQRQIQLDYEEDIRKYAEEAGSGENSKCLSECSGTACQRE